MKNCSFDLIVVSREKDIYKVQFSINEEVKEVSELEYYYLDALSMAADFIGTCCEKYDIDSRFDHVKVNLSLDWF